ncbi:MAG: transporter substrate-binding domain-containing protein [Rickettsiales bacterium]
MRNIWGVLFYIFIAWNSAYAEDKIIKIAIGDFPPFEYLDNGKVVGINQLTISEVFSRIGYKAEFYPFTWKRALSLTESGDMDAIASIQKSSERESKFIFSNPIMYSQFYLLKKKDKNIEINSFSDLEKYNVAIIDDYFYGQEFAQANLSNLAPIASATPDVNNLEKLDKERVDLVVCSKHVCEYWINKYNNLFSDINYISSFPIDPGHMLYLAFSKNNLEKSQELVQKFNAELAKYIAEGNIEKNIQNNPDNKAILVGFDRKKLQ